MNYRSIVCFLVAALFCCSTASAQDRFEVDGSHTSIIFAISHFNLSYTYGRFNEVGGVYILNRDDPTQSRFQFTINAATIDTNDTARDEHLRGGEFFDVEQFPEITFVSREVTFAEGVYSVTGDFTMHGVTNPVTMDLKLVGEGQGPFGKTRSGFFSKFRIKRSEFGMQQMLKGIGDEVAISFSFEGIKQ